MNQLARKIMSELVIAVYQIEVTNRSSLKAFLVKLFSKDFKEFIGSHFKQCSPLGRTPIAQKMMADVMTFVNCKTAQFLTNSLTTFYDQFNEGLTYRAYNMRDLTEDDYDLIIASKPGTLTIKGYRIVTKMKAPVIASSTLVKASSSVQYEKMETVEQIDVIETDSFDDETSSSSNSQPVIVQHVLTLRQDEISFGGGAFVGKKISLKDKTNLPTTFNETTIPKDQGMIFADHLTPEGGVQEMVFADVLQEEDDQEIILMELGGEEILLEQPENEIGDELGGELAAVPANVSIE